MKQIKLETNDFIILIELSGNAGISVAGNISSNLRLSDDNCNSEWNRSIDALESLILAHACAGLDVSSDQYIKGIETSLEAIANNNWIG